MKRPEFCVNVGNEDLCLGCGADRDGVCESVHGHQPSHPCPDFEVQRHDDLPEELAARLQALIRTT